MDDVAHDGIGFDHPGPTGKRVDPDATFGMLLFMQFGLGGVGVMFLPRLVPEHGTWVLFASLIAFSAVTLAMLPLIPAYPREDARRTERGGSMMSMPLLLTDVRLALSNDVL